MQRNARRAVSGSAGQAGFKKGLKLGQKTPGIFDARRRGMLRTVQALPRTEAENQNRLVRSGGTFFRAFRRYAVPMRKGEAHAQ